MTETVIALINTGLQAVRV